MALTEDAYVKPRTIWVQQLAVSLDDLDARSTSRRQDARILCGQATEKQVLNGERSVPPIAATVVHGDDHGMAFTPAGVTFHAIPPSRHLVLRIAEIWGIENARVDAPYKIKPEAAQQLREEGNRSFDLLMTHDAPAGAYPFGGSAFVTQIIRATSPKLHLFGHVPPIQGRHEFSVKDSRTKSLVFKDVSFGKDGNAA